VACGRGGKLARAVLTVLLVGGLIFLVACFKGGPIPTGAPVSITLIPNTTDVTPGQSVTVTADVYDQTGQGATWTISPLNFGTFSKESTMSVTYTPPNSFATTETVTITATSIADPTVTSSVQITATPLSVSFSPPSAQTLNQGEGQTCPSQPLILSSCLLIQAAVNGDNTSKGVRWTLSPSSGAGSLSSIQPLSVIYVAPLIVSAPTTVTVTATSVASPIALQSLNITVLPSGGGLNVAMVNVDGGPVPGQVYANAAFTSLTICKPGSTTACQNISGILVDTGSYGLRILQSGIPQLKLTQLLDANGNILENCDSFPDGSFLWGPVALADIYIAGEFASSAPVQVVNDSVNEVVPDGCANGGNNLNTSQLLGANGILGIGPEPNDCTVGGVNYCDGSSQTVPPNVYYACPSVGCKSSDSPVIVPAIRQVANPVFLLNQDSNGVILRFPQVSESEVSLQGTMVFGIGTETGSTFYAENGLGNATVFTLDASDHFTTVFNGQSLTGSSFDSGSDGLFFPDELPTCAQHTEFYCPASVTELSATIEGTSQERVLVDFSVANADDLLSSFPNDAVFPALAGPQGNFGSCKDGNASCVFDWGLPFFYGRSVYTAIDTQTVTGAPRPPWWAY
jgi:hypothetical protein